MNHTPDRSTSDLWARFRFSVVGSLLSSPPARGELKAAIEALAEKTWTHPVSGRDSMADEVERWEMEKHEERVSGIKQYFFQKETGHPF